LGNGLIGLAESKAFNRRVRGGKSAEDAEKGKGEMQFAVSGQHLVPREILRSA